MEWNFEIGVAGFVEKKFEGDVEEGFVEQMAVWPEEVGQCEAVGEEQGQTCEVGLSQVRVCVFEKPGGSWCWSG